MKDFNVTLEKKSGVTLATKDTVCDSDVKIMLDGESLARLLPKYIKKGVTILGVTGTYDGTLKVENSHNNLEQLGQKIMIATAKKPSSFTFADICRTPHIDEKVMQRLTVDDGGIRRILASRQIAGAAGTSIGDYYKVVEAESQSNLTKTSSIDYYFAYTDENIYFAIKDVGGVWRTPSEEDFIIRNNYYIRFGFDLEDYSKCMVVPILRDNMINMGTKDNAVNKVSFFSSSYSSARLEKAEGIVTNFSITKQFLDDDGNVLSEKKTNANATSPYVSYIKLEINKEKLLEAWNSAFSNSPIMSIPFFIFVSLSCCAYNQQGDALCTPFYGTVLDSEEMAKMALEKKCPILPDVIIIDSSLVYYGTAEKLSTSREKLAAVSIGNYALFGGGSYLPSRYAIVDAYDKNLVRTIPTPLSVAREGLKAVKIGDYALFGGGEYETTSNGYPKSTSKVDAYDKSLTLINPTAMSIGVYYYGATSVGDYALFGGGESTWGSTSTGIAYSAVTNSVDAYDKSLTKRTPTQLSVSRCGLTATKVGGYALFGGGDNSEFKDLDVVDAYNKNLTRTIPTPLSSARAVTAINIGSFAMFGGSKIDVYDASLTRMLLSGGVSGSATLLCGEYAIFSTGVAYDASLTRRSIEGLSQARSAVGVTIGEFALFGGGSNSSTKYSTVDVYTIT